jgi:hypothetical protein
MKIANRKGLRKQKGSFIAELGPALGFLFIGIFFPLVDLVNIGFIYASGFTLNNLQTRQGALLPKSEATDPTGAVMFTIPQDWKNSGIGKFVKMIGDPQTKVTYITGIPESSGVQDMSVVVSTTITVQPFVNAQFIPDVPGLTAPFTFNFTSQAVLENPDDVNS